MRMFSLEYEMPNVVCQECEVEQEWGIFDREVRGNCGVTDLGPPADD